MNKVVLSLFLFFGSFKFYAQSYQFTTKAPLIGSNKSYRNEIGWDIYSIKVTDQELIVTFMVDNISGRRTPGRIRGMSSLMLVEDYIPGIETAVQEAWRLHSGDEKSFWTYFRYGSEIPWVKRVQTPTLYSGGSRYWSSFSPYFSVSSPTYFYLFEVVFPPIPRGIETISIVDYFYGNRFENIKIKNPFPEHLTTGITSVTQLKELWNKSKPDPVEGIYDWLGQDYSIGIKYIDTEDSYGLIYISGGTSPWVCGDLKGTLTKTATPGLFKVSWFARDMTIISGSYAIIENGSMKIMGLLEEEQLFLKIYPSYDSKNPSDTKTWSGTGFALNSDGYIITNYHVIEGGTEINVRGINGDFSKKYPAKVILTDKANDIAICQLFNIDVGSPPYSFTFSTQPVASECYTLGYPMKQVLGDEMKFTDGKISSKSGYLGDVGSYQITVPVQPGNSGGPLFNENGEVIGIVSSKIVGAENVTYAIKSNQLLNLIDVHNEPLLLPKKNLLSNLNITEKIKESRDFIYIIEVN